ncbi:SusC/RagA family TonB-linked outer membrane protein [Pedobacter sandarakinus]|uniref:SusC/RagA family TonB-linked outer membrane protein n=1 Tax=Pedobacter sandarakinus TaxID=353156 RepID=UPI002246BD33|nr:SusC/RagA family TonB-linked outer membrane protein [Pedobacter sandarakinus]MCX2575715.1 SusC/RagA family TonB-linked outer membrane protein [Pedobacter sandarakinus]
MKINNFNARKMKWNFFLLVVAILLIMLSAFTAYAQDNQEVRGKVTDLDGKSIIVSIRFKGGVTLADRDGSFAIKGLKLGDTIRFTATGFKSVTRTNEKPGSFMSIKMTEEIQQLEEVLVQTGYQSAKPNEINGTISLIDEKALNARSGTSILDRLIGQSSGLMLQVGKSNNNPQNNTNISIRGLGTINGPLDPLIVLDGFIYEGDIANINPNDVENVSILKDAASASIWGARAGNGVIIITTKKGKLNQAMQLSFNANFLLQDLPKLTAVGQMENSDYIAVEKQLFNAGYFNDRITSTPWAAITPVVEILLAQRDGKISQSTADEQVQNLLKNNTQQSYLDNFYTRALTQQYNLNIKGGGERNSYLFSAAYDHVKGETYSNTDKLNLHLANDFKLLKKLDLNTNIYFTNVDSKTGRPSFNSLSIGSRYPTYMDFSSPGGMATSYRSIYTDTLASGKFLDWKYYPTEDYKHDYNRRKTQELYANFGLKYQILDGLNLQLNYQYQRQNSSDERTSDAESYAARNLVNTFSQFNRATGIVTYPVPKGGILLANTSVVNSQTGRAQFNYNRIFGVHSITAIAGSEVRSSNTSAMGNRRLGYQSDPLYFSPVDEVGYYPEYLTGNTNQIGGVNTLLETAYRFLSMYSNVAYSYKGKYLISGSVRRDGSNIFGANTNDKWKPLWSAGLGWKVSDESFYNIDWLPVLRLTGTFGYSGNVDLSKTALPIAGYGTNSITRFPITRINTINNPDLRWEQLSQLNLKIDFELKKQVLSGSLAWYVKRGSDLYGRDSYDYTSWGANDEIVRNVADMVGHGFDADFHSRNIQGKNFSWNSDLFFSYNLSKTKKYYSKTMASIYSMISGGNYITPLEGYPLYAVAAYKWGGLDNKGNPQGYLNGSLSTDYAAMLNEASNTGSNLVYLGASSPAYFGSIINTFRFKGLSVSFNLNYKLGYRVKKPTISYSQLISNGIGNAQFSNRWQNPGDEQKTNVPSFIYPNSSLRDAFFYSSEPNVMRGDHVRMDYLRIGYTLNTSQWKSPFRNLELYSGMQNIGILWRANKDGYDPDYANVIPPSLQFSFGIKGAF